MLSTARLLLRRPERSDLDDLFKVFSDPQAMRYWSTAPHADPSVTLERLERMIARFDTQPIYFCIELDGRAIGTAGMIPENEVGFILHPDFHRKGMMSEVMEAIIPHLWRTTDVDHLIADADPLNAASIGLLTSLGFVETHRAKNTFFINDVWSDSVYFALRRPSETTNMSQS